MHIYDIIKMYGDRYNLSTGKRKLEKKKKKAWNNIMWVALYMTVALVAFMSIFKLVMVYLRPEPCVSLKIFTATFAAICTAFVAELPVLAVHLYRRY